MAGLHLKVVYRFRYLLRGLVLWSFWDMNRVKAFLNLAWEVGLSLFDFLNVFILQVLDLLMRDLFLKRFLLLVLTIIWFTWLDFTWRLWLHLLVLEPNFEAFLRTEQVLQTKLAVWFQFLFKLFSILLFVLSMPQTILRHSDLTLEFLLGVYIRSRPCSTIRARHCWSMMGLYLLR